MPLLLFLAAAGALAFTVWFEASVFVPIRTDGRGTEYLLVSKPFSVLAAAFVAAMVLLAIVHVCVAWRKVRQSTGRQWLTAENTQYLQPLLGLWLIALSALALAPWPARYLGVWLYLIVDLRWWWRALLLAWAVASAMRQRGIELARWKPRAGRVWPELGLAASLVSVSVVSAPLVRFTGVLHGDEPKYIRYCESLYQGRGFDLSGLKSFVELGAEYRPRVWANLAGLAAAIPEEARNLVDDAATLLREGPRHRFNRAVFIDGWFLQGKRPGSFYQVHNPGLSMLLFPAYYVDRRFVPNAPGYERQLPVRLPAVYTLLIALYAAAGVLLFRLLCAHTGRPTLAWLLALVAMVTLPVSAFPFQIYPELAAAVLVLAIVSYLHRVRRSGLPAGVLCGLAAGYLPWLHVRFLLLSLVFLVWVLIRQPRGRRAAAGFGAGYTMALGALALYAYRLTGSLLPTAMYQAAGNPDPFRLGRLLQGLRAYPFDRIWGLFAHSPVYLLGLAGVWPMLRRRSDTLALASLVIGALLIPAAGHDFTAAGGSPLRYLVAVVPLGMLFVAEALVSCAGKRFVVVGFIVAAIVSLDNAVVYNWHHVKETGRLVAWGFSGWRTNLLFPWAHGDVWSSSTVNFILFVGWVAAAVILCFLPLLLCRRGDGMDRTRQMRPFVDATGVTGRSLAAGFLVLGCLGSAVSAVTGDLAWEDYLLPPAEARARAFALYTRMGRCALCYDTRQAEVDPHVVLDNPLNELLIGVRPSSPRPGQKVTIRIKAMADSERFTWGVLRVELGDGQTAGPLSAFGEIVLEHAYQQPGDYDITVHFAYGGGHIARRTAAVPVQGG